MTPLTRRFYSRSTLVVARALLGKVLYHRVGGRLLSGRIVEVEAYTDDAASHARWSRRTPRNAVMFGPAGHAYVYFTYGMHHCVNIVTESNGRPGAVLLRGLDCLRAGAPARDGSGPGRLCRALGITLSQNGLDLTTGETLWIADGRRARRERIVQTTRIGIRVAEKLRWRFYLLGSDGVSRRDRSAEAPQREMAPTCRIAGTTRSASAGGRRR